VLAGPAGNINKKCGLSSDRTTNLAICRLMLFRTERDTAKSITLIDDFKRCPAAGITGKVDDVGTQTGQKVSSDLTCHIAMPGFIDVRWCMPYFDFFLRKNLLHSCPQRFDGQRIKITENESYLMISAVPCKSDEVVK